MRAREFARWDLPVLAWAGLISFFSTGAFTAAKTGSILEPLVRFFWPAVSPEALARLHFAIRKSGHLTEYLILGLLVLRALQRGRPERRPGRPWAALALCAAFAGLDEFHQSFVPGRTPSLADVGIDSLGAALGLAWRALRRRG